VPEYRLYSLLKGTNQIKGVPTLVVCKNDIEATQEAKKILDGGDIEIWVGARCVTRINSPDTK
jgi:hypothetical protein